jgi:hypothetical protein
LSLQSAYGRQVQERRGFPSILLKPRYSQISSGAEALPGQFTLTEPMLVGHAAEVHVEALPRLGWS